MLKITQLSDGLVLTVNHWTHPVITKTTIFFPQGGRTIGLWITSRRIDKIIEAVFTSSVKMFSNSYSSSICCWPYLTNTLRVIATALYSCLGLPVSQLSALFSSDVNASVSFFVSTNTVHHWRVTTVPHSCAACPAEGVQGARDAGECSETVEHGSCLVNEKSGCQGCSKP